MAAWETRRPQLQDKQDRLFYVNANPEFAARIAALNKFLAEPQEEPQKQIFKGGSPEIESVMGREAQETNPEQLVYNAELEKRLYEALSDPKIFADFERNFLEDFFKLNDIDKLAKKYQASRKEIQNKISAIVSKLQGSEYFRDLKPITGGKGRLKV